MIDRRIDLNTLTHLHTAIGDKAFRCACETLAKKLHPVCALGGNSVFVTAALRE